jgi:phytoene/squalene synthetase
VDRDRTADAYHAYAYFRWLDDMLDEGKLGIAERMALIERQHALVEGAYRGEWPPALTLEEHLLLDLIRSDQESDSGLQAYIRNMMAVIAFDAHRRGQLISQQELDDYTRHLAIAVTEVLHYYIGHDQFAQRDEAHYHAVIAAHITHLLRDTYEDIAAGYYNIPHEYLDAHRIAPWDVKGLAYRDWVKSRVQLARDYFRTGKAYLAQDENHRRRLAGYAYVARFEGVLDAIERDGYRLRPEYGERKTLRAGLRIGWSVVTLMLRDKPMPAGLPSLLETGSCHPLDKIQHPEETL